MRRGRGGDASQTSVAEILQRLAVLLRAGVAPARAWEHLAEAGEPSAARVSAAVARGDQVATAVASAAADAPDPLAWREVAAAWSIATTVGAPLAETLRGFAAALRDAQESADDVRIALAEPAATARLVAWLPLVAVALGLAFGFDTVTVLVTHPVGIACLVAGGVLIAVSHRWTRSLVRRARPEPGIPGIDAELLAIALSGGLSIDGALQAVRATTDREPDAGVDEVLRLSSSAGVPAVELLRASATLARHRARIDARLRAARLSTRLLLPLGACTLPAFLLLGVAPMLLGVLSAVPLSL